MLNSLIGRICVDGAIVGTWGRRQHFMVVHLWAEHHRHRERVQAEAEAFAGPIGRPIDLRWLH